MHIYGSVSIFIYTCMLYTYTLSFLFFLKKFDSYPNLQVARFLKISELNKVI